MWMVFPVQLTYLVRKHWGKFSFPYYIVNIIILLCLTLCWLLVYWIPLLRDYLFAIGKALNYVFFHVPVYIVGHPENSVTDSTFPVTLSAVTFNWYHNSIQWDLGLLTADVKMSSINSYVICTFQKWSCANLLLLFIFSTSRHVK